MANGPPSVKFAPLAQTSSYAAYCGGRHFSTRLRAAFLHVGAVFGTWGIVPLPSVLTPLITKHSDMSQQTMVLSSNQRHTGTLCFESLNFHLTQIFAPL